MICKVAQRFNGLRKNYRQVTLHLSENIKKSLFFQPSLWMNIHENADKKFRKRIFIRCIVIIYYTLHSALEYHRPLGPQCPSTLAIKSKPKLRPTWIITRSANVKAPVELCIAGWKRFIYFVWRTIFHQSYPPPSFPMIYRTCIKLQIF